MAVTMTTEQTGPTSYRLLLESTEPDPVYYIYVNGVYRGSTTAPVFDMDVPETGAAVVEVFDSLEDQPSAPAASSTFTLQWEPVPDDAADRYVIRQKDGEDWNDIAVVYDIADTVMHYMTPPLEDDTEYSFRVVPVGRTSGAEGTPREFTQIVRGIPGAPSAEYSYDSGTGIDTVAW